MSCLCLRLMVSLLGLGAENPGEEGRSGSRGAGPRRLSSAEPAFRLATLPRAHPGHGRAEGVGRVSGPPRLPLSAHQPRVCQTPSQGRGLSGPCWESGPEAPCGADRSGERQGASSVLGRERGCFLPSPHWRLCGDPEGLALLHFHR